MSKTTNSSVSESITAYLYKNRWMVIFGSVFLVFLVVIGLYDVPISKFLMSKRVGFWNKASHFVHATLFANGEVGLTDAVLFAFFVWLALFVRNIRNKKQHPAFLFYYPSFLVFNTLWLSVFFVRGLKNLVGRARPYDVYSDQLFYSPWWEFGAHYSHDKVIFQGSFPSGHVISMGCLFAFAYMLFKNKFTYRMITLVFVTCICLVTALGRTMHGSHWLTDGLCSTGLAWIFTRQHFLMVERLFEEDRITHWLYIKKSLIYFSAAWVALVGLTFTLRILI